ncbi:MAG: type IV secretory system conjugative DNA transfer family protein [Gammaproteobacteria bacterium (ex Lamellibrachia satsuma)]|nr:MAG: type IV secretory system conjugative DNA transfer family protein [Gammaproteobacteria bacterium (ex Lamellibrachia satsuma)]
MAAFNEDFMHDVPRGVSTRYLKQQSIPQAKWQTPETILKSKALAYDPDRPGKKILVGAIGKALIGIADDRHIGTIAGSRAGKSLMLIANLFFYQGSVLATDPKAELANLTALKRARLGQKIYILDPFGYTDEKVAGFLASYNPMAVLSLDSPTIIEDASLIAEAMVVQAIGQKDLHWDESAKNFIEGIILYVASDPQFEGGRNLVTVRELIKQAMLLAPSPEADEEPYYILEEGMLDSARHLQKFEGTADLGGTIEGSARDFYDKSDRERDSVLSTVRRHTKFLDYTAMRKILKDHDFDLADLKRDPKGVTVYLCFPATRSEISNRWLRMFINQLLDAMEREKTVPAAPVLACLDEFPVLGYMRQLESAIGQIASFHVKLWFILQDWNQGKALYKERWESFVGNAGIMQFFGNNDLTTTEYISKKLGKTPVEVSRLGEVGTQQQEMGMTGRSNTIELHDLLTPEEISHLFARSDRLKRQLVFWAGYHPMILQRVEYFDQEDALSPYF